MATGEGGGLPGGEASRSTGHRFANHPENQAMTVYMPILKGRIPSFLALGHATEQVKNSIRPVIEVVPGRDDDNVKSIVLRVAGQVDRHITDGMILSFDTAPLVREFGDSASREALSLLSTQLRGRGHTFRPVIHPDDDPDDLDDIRQLAHEHQMGVCLRVDWPYVYRLGDARPLLEQLDAVGATVEQADVVLDCGFIRSAADAINGVSAPLAHLLGIAWQSIVIAAGSFPSPDDLGRLPARRVNSIPRQEALLWRRISRRWPHAVDFGDYGVDHPGPPSDRPSPGPSLRYTMADDWRLYQWPKDAFGKHSTFHQLCRTLIASSDWPRAGPAFSWGDERIDLAARERIGPGAGTQWKAYAVSHHLASIVTAMAPETAVT